PLVLLQLLAVAVVHQVFAGPLCNAGKFAEGMAQVEGTVAQLVRDGGCQITRVLYEDIAELAFEGHEACAGRAATLDQEDVIRVFVNIAIALELRIEVAHLLIETGKQTGFLGIETAEHFRINKKLNKSNNAIVAVDSSPCICDHISTRVVPSPMVR